MIQCNCNGWEQFGKEGLHWISCVAKVCISNVLEPHKLKKQSVPSRDNWIYEWVTLSLKCCLLMVMFHTSECNLVDILHVFIDGIHPYLFFSVFYILQEDFNVKDRWSCIVWSVVFFFVLGLEKVHDQVIINEVYTLLHGGELSIQVWMIWQLLLKSPTYLSYTFMNNMMWYWLLPLITKMIIIMLITIMIFLLVD